MTSKLQPGGLRFAHKRVEPPIAEDGTVANDCRRNRVRVTTPDVRPPLLPTSSVETSSSVRPFGASAGTSPTSQRSRAGC